MKIGSILRTIGKVTKIVGPALAGLGVAGPVGGIVTVVGQVAGALTKKAGQAREKDLPGSAPIHKIAAPVGSMGAAGAVLALLRWAGVEVPQEAAEALLVLIPWAMHQFGHGLSESTQARK